MQQILTSDQAWHYHIVPKTQGVNSLSFYIDEKKYDDTIRFELGILLGKDVSIEKTDSKIISKTLGKYYRKSINPHQKASKKLAINSSEDFLPTLISEAKELGSSDIHIESYEDRC